MTKVIEADLFKGDIDDFCERLKKLQRPLIDGAEAEPRELEDLVPFFLGFAACFDECFRSMGRHIGSRICGGLSEKEMQEFTDQAVNALEGNATFILEDHAARLREDNFRNSPCSPYRTLVLRALGEP